MLTWEAKPIKCRINRLDNLCEWVYSWRPTMYVVCITNKCFFFGEWCDACVTGKQWERSGYVPLLPLEQCLHRRWTTTTTTATSSLLSSSRWPWWLLPHTHTIIITLIIVWWEGWSEVSPHTQHIHPQDTHTTNVPNVPRNQGDLKWDWGQYAQRIL